MKGGEVSSVIDSLSQQIRAAGKSVKLYEDSWDLALECRTNEKGISPCYGAVVFFSSPSEETSSSSKGQWNYTIRGGDTSESVDIRTSNNYPERYLLPLQRAVDSEIISLSNTAGKTQPSADLQIITFTEQDQDALTSTRSATYLSISIYIFGPLFAFTLVDIIYHMTSFIAREREIGTQ